MIDCKRRMSSTVCLKPSWEKSLVRDFDKLWNITRKPWRTRLKAVSMQVIGGQLHPDDERGDEEARAEEISTGPVNGAGPSSEDTCEDDKQDGDTQGASHAPAQHAADSGALAEAVMEVTALTLIISQAFSRFQLSGFNRVSGFYKLV